MEEIKITVRIPVDVADRIRRLAEAHDRSLNGEIVWALRQYSKQQGAGHGSDADDHAQNPTQPDP